MTKIYDDKNGKTQNKSLLQIENIVLNKQFLFQSRCIYRLTTKMKTKSVHPI